VTGGGEIGTGRNFGFTAQSDSGGKASGELEYQDKANGINLHSASITSVGVQSDGIHAVVTGTATVNGVAGYSFTVTVADNGEPGIGVDQFRIQITGPMRYDSNSFAANAGLLTSGNIQVHAARGAPSTSASVAAPAATILNSSINSSTNAGTAPDVQSPTIAVAAPSISVTAPIAALPVIGNAAGTTNQTGSTLTTVAPAIATAAPPSAPVQVSGLSTLAPAPTPGGGSTPAGKKLASLFGQFSSEASGFGALNELALAFNRPDSFRTFASNSEMLDDGADGFTFEALAPRLRIAAAPTSTSISLKVFDEDSGELLDIEELAMRRWLLDGLTSSETMKATPKMPSTDSGHPEPDAANAPVIDWAATFAKPRWPAGPVSR